MGIGLDEERIRIRVEEAIGYTPFNMVFDSQQASELLTKAVLAVLEVMGEQAGEAGLAGILIPAPTPKEKSDGSED